MIILGIDPGTATTGFGIVEITKTKQKKCIAYGCITTSKDTPAPLRLNHIDDDINEIIKKYKPNYVAIEQLFFYKNITTAMSVAQARGVLISAVARQKIPIFEYTPLQVKQGLTGYGKATKKDIQTMVKLELQLDKIPRPDDAADGLALAIICYTEINKSNKMDK